VGNFSHIVANLDKSLEFYRDVIGLPVNGAINPFSPNATIMRLGNTIGAQSKMVQLRVPGSAMGVEIIEYKDIERKPVQPRFQDPGAANLIVRVRDLDSVVARVKKAGAKILTAGGVPAMVGTTRAMFIQDPDGFVVELSQPAAPPAGGTDSGNIISGGFEVVVADTDKTVNFYQKVLGFQITSNPSFNNDKLMNDTAGTPGAAFRQSRGPIPGTNYTMVFIEFKDIDRKPLHTRVQDPGTAILQLNVRDMDGLMKVLKANNAEIVTTGGEPVSLGAGKLVIARDPNNLFLEFIQR
jgi:predicted enzyme related to lactoylglutathione lyase